MQDFERTQERTFSKDWSIWLQVMRFFYDVFGIEYMYASMLFHWQQFFLLVEYLKSSWPHVRAELIYNKNLGCHFINT